MIWQNYSVNVSPNEPLPPRGWYPDPVSAGRERYWDGGQWTQIVRHAEVVEPKHPGTQQIFQSQPEPARASDPALALPLAPWWTRLVSGIIDYGIVTVVTALMLAVAGRAWVTHLGTMIQDYGDSVLQSLATGGSYPLIPDALARGTQNLLLIFGGVLIVYTVIFLGTWGATIGHRSLGLQVIKAPLPVSVLSSTNQRVRFSPEKPGWMRAVFKGFSWMVLSVGGNIFFILQLVNVVLPLVTKRKQSMTDLFSNTLLMRGKLSAEAPAATIE